MCCRIRPEQAFITDDHFQSLFDNCDRVTYNEDTFSYIEVI